MTHRSALAQAAQTNPMSFVLERHKTLIDRLNTARCELRIVQEGLNLVSAHLGKPSHLRPVVVDEELTTAREHTARAIVEIRKELASGVVAYSYYLLSECYFT
jgi:hypothetical protein